MGMHEDIKARIAERLEHLKDHALTVQVDVEGARVYRMAKPGTNNMATDIAVVCGCVVITGDHAPGKYGVVSRCGYDEHWLARNAESYSYLGEKLLPQSYQPEVAEWHVRERRDELLAELAEGVGDDEELAWKETLDEFLAEDCSAEALSIHEDDLYVIFDEIPGHWYDPEDIVTLSAIATRFGQLLGGKDR